MLPRSKSLLVEKSSDEKKTQMGLKFNDIMLKYGEIEISLENIMQDVLKLERAHQDYIKSDTNSRFHEYGIYIDDIYFQSKILRMEYAFFSGLIMMAINKLYKDLFRLYRTVVKKLSSYCFEENKDTKKYFARVKTYEELKDREYTTGDIKILFDELTKRMDELWNSESEINKVLSDATHKYEEGLLLQTFMISLGGERDKLHVDYKVYMRILDSVLDVHSRLARKYEMRLNAIAVEILDTDEMNSVNTEYNTPRSDDQKISIDADSIISLTRSKSQMLLQEIDEIRSSTE